MSFGNQEWCTTDHIRKLEQYIIDDCDNLTSEKRGQCIGFEKEMRDYLRDIDCDAMPGRGYIKTPEGKQEHNWTKVDGSTITDLDTDSTVIVDATVEQFEDEFGRDFPSVAIYTPDNEMYSTYFDKQLR